MSKPWLQREGETDLAYKGFELYCTDRDTTILDAYVQYVKWHFEGEKGEAKARKAQERGRAPGHFENWCADHDWRERRKAYFKHIDERAYEKLMESKARRKVERVELLDGVMGELENDLSDRVGQELQTADLQDIARILDRLLKHYREELDDLPTQRHEVGGADEIAAMLGVDFDEDG